MTADSVGASEGVIKFRLSFRTAPPPRHPGLAELEGWRRLLHRLGMIGRAPNRYGGLAYGNVSLRTGAGRFLVSGTQTGGASLLTDADYCRVESWNLVTHRLRASGPIRPSSEALSHAALYQADRSIGCVIHVHSPELWAAARDGRLAIPVTPAELQYGTSELAVSVAELADARSAPVICMGGHEDGLLAYGEGPEAAATALLRLLAGVLGAARA